jgi:cell division protein FtsB
VRKGILAALVVVALAAGALVLFSVLSDNGYASIARQRANVAALENEKARLAIQVDQLEREIDAIKAGGAYRQKVIRDELGYVRGNEVVIDLGGPTAP